MKRYPAYRDSGVEWLGEVPGHWRVVQLKHVCKFFTGWTPPTGDSEAYVGENLWANISDLGQPVIYDTVKRLSDAAIARHGIQSCPAGSLLFSFKLSIGQVSFAGQEMYTNEAIATFPPSPNIDLTFAFYAFPEMVVRNASENIYGAKMLNQFLINSAILLVPPLPEQTAIAAFLDLETAKIDGLVAEQRRLIDLLREKRQAMISHAVTKGLNPATPLKPSGIDWLGDVPSHWTAPLSFKRVADRVVVGIAEAAAYAYVEVGVPILRSMNVRAGRIIGDLLYLDPAYSTDRDSKVLYAGDLITVRTGHAGVTAVIPQNLDGCQCFTMLITTLKAGMSPQYFCYWMNSLHAVYYFGLEAWGSAQPNISVPILQDIPVFAPPIEEQIAIALFLDETTAKLDTLTITAESAIALLEERRAALISAAVTGKIDVRPLMDKGSHAA